VIILFAGMLCCADAVEVMCVGFPHYGFRHRARSIETASSSCSFRIVDVCYTGPSTSVLATNA
jgi:hypothetical protein